MPRDERQNKPESLTERARTADCVDFAVNILLMLHLPEEINPGDQSDRNSFAKG